MTLLNEMLWLAIKGLAYIAIGYTLHQIGIQLTHPGFWLVIALTLICDLTSIWYSNARIFRLLTEIETDGHKETQIPDR
jgi:hypothetical protein